MSSDMTAILSSNECTVLASRKQFSVASCGGGGVDENGGDVRVNTAPSSPGFGKGSNDAGQK